MSRRDDLERLRAVLLGALMDAASSQVAAVAGLSKELRAVNAELEALPSEEVDPLDALAARHRLSVAPVPRSA